MSDTPATQDPATAELERIRARQAARAKVGGMGADPGDAKRLLAAVEITLQLHYPVVTDYLDGDGVERSSRECSECAPPGTPDNWPCLTVRAITTALTGKEPDNG